MRVRVQIGSVMVDLQGVDMSTRAVKNLIDHIAEKNAAIDDAPEAEPEKAPIGFNVITERDTEGLPQESYFTDD